MSERGAPTGMYQTMPEHLQDKEAFDLEKAEARLILRRPGLPEVTLPIERPEFVIGRAVEGVDLTLDDDLVSRQHAKLTVNERGYFRVEDLGSTNGVHFEGRRVKRLNLLDGDVFTIGDATLEFHANLDRFRAQPPAPPPRPRADSVFADVDIPEPRPERIEDEGSVVGWDPEAAKARMQAPPPAAQAEESQESD